MNGACRFLSTVAGVALLGGLAATPGLAADADTNGPQWLSIGIPDHLQGNDAAALRVAREDDRSLFSTSYEIGRFSVHGGRINPSFGLAWDKATGFYGTNMAGESDSPDLYSLSTSLNFDPPGWGSHSLSGQTLLLDRAQRNGFAQGNLDFRNRTPGSGEDGPASSFNLVLEGGSFPILPELTYRFALINPASGGAGVTEAGTGFAAGLSTRFDLGQGISVSPTVETARLNDPAGAKNRERQYWSTSMLTEWRNWNLDLSYTQRETEEDDAAINEYHAKASLGYAFDFGLSADLGWYRTEEENDSTDQFGFRFTYPLKIGK